METLTFRLPQHTCVCMVLWCKQTAMVIKCTSKQFMILESLLYDLTDDHASYLLLTLLGTLASPITLEFYCIINATVVEHVKGVFIYTYVLLAT